MSTRKLLEPGTWFAGFSVPFFVSNSMISTKLETMGFREIKIFDRTDKAPPVNARLDPRYADDWDQWLTAEYVGKPQALDMPSQIKWLLHATRPAQGAPPASPPPGLPPAGKPPGGAVAGKLIGGALLLGGLYLGFQAVRS